MNHPTYNSTSDTGATARPLRVCLVSQEYPPETARGGIGSQTWNKAHALAARGHTVHVLSSAAKDGPPLRTEIESGITVHRMRTPGRDFPVYNDPTYWLGYAWNVLSHLQPLMAQHAYDLIDVAEYSAEGLAYQLDRTPWNWAAVVVQLHGPLALLVERVGWPERDSVFAQVGTHLEGVSIREADALMACSANIADFTADYYRLDRASIDVVHCGVDATTFTPSGGAAGTDEPGPVLFVGNLAANKGLGLVVDAVLRVRRRFPSVKLDILGKGDPDAVAALHRTIETHAAQDNIRVVGFVGDRAKLPEYYRRASVFCSPAPHESGVANVYIEAMACGCPVIACNTGGALEAVTHEETGLLVQPGNLEQMTAALERILGDAALRARLGAAARKRVDDYFAMDKYIQRVLATYGRALRTARQKRERLP